MSVESAVSFAASMIRKGQYIGTAINIAANYYKVNRADVQRGLASRSGKAQAGKKKPIRPVMRCANCDNEAVWKCICYYGFNSVIYHTCEKCGKNIPHHHEGTVDRVKWTRYVPSKKSNSDASSVSK